jgi:hypothetical protein
MAVANISRVKSIVVPIAAINGSSIVTIYQHPGDIAIDNQFMEAGRVISFNCFIKNLKAFAKIASIPEAALPDIQLEDTSSQKLYKVLDIEWKSARKQMNLFISTGNSDWQQVGSVSLLNPAGYPFRVYNLMDFFTDNLALELGDNSKIGIAMQDVGYGVLTSNDKVTIHGSYTEEIFVKSDEPPININITGGGSVTPVITDYSVNNSNLINNSFLAGN